MQAFFNPFVSRFHRCELYESWEVRSPISTILSFLLRSASIWRFAKGRCHKILTFSKIKIGLLFYQKLSLERVPCWQPRRLTVLVSNGRPVAKFFAGFVYVSVVLKKGLYIGFRILMFDLCDKRPNFSPGIRASRTYEVLSNVFSIIFYFYTCTFFLLTLLLICVLKNYVLPLSIPLDSHFFWSYWSWELGRSIWV